MAQFSISGQQPINTAPMRPAAQQRAATPAVQQSSAAAPAADRMSAPPAGGAAAPQLSLHDDPAVLTALRSQLLEKGLSARLGTQSAGLSPQAGQTLCRLQELVKHPRLFLDTVEHVLSQPGLDPQLRQDLERVLAQVSAAVEAGKRGETGLLEQLLTQPVHESKLPISLYDGIGYLAQAMTFDANMKKFDRRDTVVQVVNQAYQKAGELIAGGNVASAQALELEVFGGVESELNRQSGALLGAIASGEVQTKIDALKQSFAAYLQVPGFQELLFEAVTAAGIPATSESLTDEKFLALITQQQYQKVGQILQQKLQGLNEELTSLPADAPGRKRISDLRTALDSTLKTLLPETLKLKNEYQHFKAVLNGYLGEVKGNIRQLSSELKLPLPPGYLDKALSNPAEAFASLKSHLAELRRAAAGNPDRLHEIDALEQFGMQLEIGASMYQRVHNGEQIEGNLIDSYEHFQSFVLAKRALIQAFDRAAGGSDTGLSGKLRQAVLEFGENFAQWSSLPAAERQQKLFDWLADKLDPAKLSELREQTGSSRIGFEQHNQRVRDAKAQGVELVDPREVRPLSAPAGDHAARLAELARRESAYYRQVQAERGDEGLRAVLRRDLELVLEPSASSMQNFNRMLEQLDRQVAQLLRSHSQTSKATALPAAREIGDRLDTARAQQRLAQEVEKIKQEIILSLRDTRHQAKALAAARKLREQLQQQIFELSNQRASEAARHRQESLKVIDEQLKVLLEEG